MRPLYALLVWIAVLGGLWLYTTARDALDRPSTTAVEIQPAPGKYELVLTPTFDAVTSVDDFGVDRTTKPAIYAMLNGSEVVRFTDVASAGKAQRFSWDTNNVPMRIEDNLFFLELTAPPGDADAFRGVRVQVLRDGESIVDEMLWSQPGGPVSGTIALDVPPKPETSDHEGHE